MAPEYGATCVIFPIDDVTLRYLRFTGRDDEPRGPGGGVRQGAGHVPPGRGPRAGVLRDGRRSTCPPWNRAWPDRPGPRTGWLSPMPRPALRRSLDGGRAPATAPTAALRVATVGVEGAGPWRSADGHVVIAAITSCTNTSNPQVMLAAGLLAQKAVARGPAVQTVGEDVARPGVAGGHGLLRAGRAARAARRRSGSNSSASAARPASATRALCCPASPRRCTTVTCRWPRCCRGTATSRAASTPTSGSTTWPRRRWWWPTPWPARWTSTSPPSRSAPAPTADPVYLRDIWPTPAEVAEVIEQAVTSEMFRARYGSVFEGDDRWKDDRQPAAVTPSPGTRDSTYVLQAALLRRHSAPSRRRCADIVGARVLAILGRQRHHRPHLARRLHPAQLPGRGVPDRARRGSRRSSTPTGLVGATTRS